MPCHARIQGIPCINNTQHIHTADKNPAPPAGQPPSRQAETRRGARNGQGGEPHNSSKNQKRKGEQHRRERGNEGTRQSRPTQINQSRGPGPAPAKTSNEIMGRRLLERACVCVFTALVTVGSRSRVPLFPRKYIRRRSRLSTRVREIALMLTLFGYYRITVSSHRRRWAASFSFMRSWVHFASFV